MLAVEQDLVFRIYAALSNDPITEDAFIEVLDRNGRISLVGEVESADVKNTAVQVVKNLPGVVAVNNRILVKRTRK